LIPYIILGLGAWYAGFLWVTSCARGHWWAHHIDACWRCERTGTQIVKEEM
jgi:hypothetical protein